MGTLEEIIRDIRSTAQKCYLDTGAMSLMPKTVFETVEDFHEWTVICRILERSRHTAKQNRTIDRKCSGRDHVFAEYIHGDQSGGKSC